MKKRWKMVKGKAVQADECANGSRILTVLILEVNHWHSHDDSLNVHSLDIEGLKINGSDMDGLLLTIQIFTIWILMV